MIQRIDDFVELADYVPQGPLSRIQALPQRDLPGRVDGVSEAQEVIVGTGDGFLGRFEAIDEIVEVALRAHGPSAQERAIARNFSTRPRQTCPMKPNTCPTNVDTRDTL